MRDKDSSDSSASLGADANARRSGVDYHVLNLHAAIKQELHCTENKCSVKRRKPPSDTTGVINELTRALHSKQHLLGTKRGTDADEGWQVSWTSNDSQSLLQAVQAATYDLPSCADADAHTDVARNVVKAAVDLPVQDLCQLAITIRHSWDLLPRQQKQLDHAPLDLVCSLGLLLSRLYPCAAACAAGGPLQQQALVLLQQICSSAAQQLLQESLACHVFIFRWHEEQQQHGEMEAAGGSRCSLPGCVSQYYSACSQNSSNSAMPAVESVLEAGNSRHQPLAQPCEVTPVDSKTPAAQAATVVKGTQYHCGSGHHTTAVPRLISATHVPHAHRKWIGSFQLPVIPTTVHWGAAQEVLLGWNNITNDKLAHDTAAGLGLDPVISPDSFMLAVEALWLFTQSPDGFITPRHPPPPPAAAAAANPGACADAVPAAAAAVIGDDQRAGLWSSLLLRLISIIETQGSAVAAAVLADTAAGSSSSQEAAAAIRLDLITPVSNVLFSILAECLMRLTDLWQQQPAAARSALIRCVISGSDQAVITRQKKISQLLGKAKPKESEVASSRLLLLVNHLAAVLVELLQLERTLCGGPRRDGSVPVNASGEEAPWFSCLWITTPISMSQMLELLLRCPAPVNDNITTLIELLMDDLWEALRMLPLMEPDNSVNCVSNTAVGTSYENCQKQLCDGTKLGWGVACSKRQPPPQQQPSLGADLLRPAVQGKSAAAAAAVVGPCSGTPTYDTAVAKAVTAAIVTTQKAIRSWQAAISQVLLLPAGTAAAAAAAAEPTHGSTCATVGRCKVSNTKGARKITDAEQVSPQNAAAAADDAAAAPCWMLAAAAADPGAAVDFMLTLLNRGLDCAQKAYYWRWYVWWQQQQQAQQQQGQEQDGEAACKAATADAGSAALGSSTGSSSTNNSSSSSVDNSSGNYMDDWCGSSGSFLSSSSSSSSSSCDAYEAAADATATATAATAAAATDGTLLPAAAAAGSSSSSSDGPSAKLNTALWGDAAFRHALGFTALAGPAFGFVNSVIKIGYKNLPESQQKRNTESSLALLDSVSVGLQSNTLILVELNRRLLLPEFEAAAAAGWLRSTLDSMLAKALTAAAAAAAPKGDHGTTKQSTDGLSRRSAKPPTAAAAAAAAAGSTGAAAAAVIMPPDAAASLDDYDSYWCQLSFNPIDQLTLSKAAAGLLIAARVHPKPSFLSPIGCHNPNCHNMSGFSESQLKTLACRACRQVGYCSRACQRQHWKVHKVECQQWQQQQDCEWVDVFSDDFAELLEH